MTWPLWNNLLNINDIDVWEYIYKKEIYLTKRLEAEIGQKLWNCKNWKKKISEILQNILDLQ